MGVADLARAIRERRVSAREVVEDCLRRCEAADRELHAFRTVAGERALAEADAADRVRDGGPLRGVPIAVKDLQETAGIRTTYGSLRCADLVPEEDCASVRRLRAAGAIVVGKTNTPAFGFLGETKNRLGPDARHPDDHERTPGGSSGGSAAAVAAGLVPFATGTDSAGSITAPAGTCGVVGIKPTHGLVPTWPPAGDSLLMNDAGPLAGSVADAALALEVMAGHDPRDPVSLRGPVPPLAPAAASDRPLLGLRLAYSDDLGRFAVDTEVAGAARRAAVAFEELGARIVERAPAFEPPFDLYMPLYATDARAGLGPGLEACEDLFPETVAELRAHPPMGAEAYVGLLNRLWRFRGAAAGFFAEHDLLLTPSTAAPAFRLRRPPERIGGRPVTPGWTSSMPFSVPWNLTGQPTASVPCDRTRDGLPVGLLIVGRHREDALVLRAAAAFERVRR